jgi:Ca2+-transporting ATPase
MQDQLPAYQRPVADVLLALGVDARRGLSEADVRLRLKRYGANEMAAEQKPPAWRRFLAQFQDVLVILLLVAVAISVGIWLYGRESALPYDSIAIAVIVLLNAVMGYVQESRAEAAVAALRRMTAARARVVRDGAQHSIPAAEIVPGDIILIEEGDVIPADARVMQSI